MQIITLTTDMGLKDHYVAAVKGTLYKSNPGVTIVDISHEVRPFDVAEAAYYLRSCFEDFPEGTIHIIGVDAEPMVNFGGSEGSFPSILVFKGHYFVGNDNGFFGSFLQENIPEAFYRIDDVLSKISLFKFPTKNIFAPIASRIVAGDELDSFASAYTHYKKALESNAIIETNLIKGKVVHVDNFGNIITDVHKTLIERFAKDIPFTIYYRNKDYYIEEISATYNSVPVGEKVAIFNDRGFLEIAINRGANGSNGGAEKLFGVRIGDVVRVEFTPKGSHTTLDSLF